MSSSNMYTRELSRGKKALRSTGLDNSSYGETGTKTLKGNIQKGDARDISSSIKDGQVRKY